MQRLQILFVVISFLFVSHPVFNQINLFDIASHCQAVGGQSVSWQAGSHQITQAQGNQITVVAFQPVQLGQASFLQKNQTLQNVFLMSVTLRGCRASVVCKNQNF